MWCQNKLTLRLKTACFINLPDFAYSYLGQNQDVKNPKLEHVMILWLIVINHSKSRD